MVENLPPGATWEVIGISHAQWRLLAAAIGMGGNIRVGLEDNFYLPDGTMARSNGDLVAKAREMVVNAGRRPATVAEARSLLVDVARGKTYPPLMNNTRTIDLLKCFPRRGKIEKNLTILSAIQM